LDTSNLLWRSPNSVAFTQAAKLLHLSQPALTVQINQLEASLNNVRLLDRTTRSVRLTKVGKELLPAVQQIIGDVEKLVSDAKKVSREKESIVKTAAISTVAAVVLPLAITSFYERYPGASVQVIDALSLAKIQSPCEMNSMRTGL
jgi:DNA-binding transcriptional LysR family regulator